MSANPIRGTYAKPLTRWQRPLVSQCEQMLDDIEHWPEILRRVMRSQIIGIRGLVLDLDTPTGSTTKRYATRTVAALRAEIASVIVAPPPETVPEELRTAYNGEAESQRGALPPRIRDVVCRAIRNEITALGQPRPPFLGIDDADQIAMLRYASSILSPRSDVEQLIIRIVERDAAAGLGS